MGLNNFNTKSASAFLQQAQAGGSVAKKVKRVSEHLEARAHHGQREIIGGGARHPGPAKARQW